jgi:hypothetical protein
MYLDQLLNTLFNHGSSTNEIYLHRVNKVCVVGGWVGGLQSKYTWGNPFEGVTGEFTLYRTPAGITNV